MKNSLFSWSISLTNNDDSYNEVKAKGLSKICKSVGGKTKSSCLAGNYGVKIVKRVNLLSKRMQHQAQFLATVERFPF